MKSFLNGFAGGLVAVALVVVCMGARQVATHAPTVQEKGKIVQWWNSLSATEKDVAKDFMDPANVDVIFGGLTLNQRKWLKANVRLWQVQMWLNHPEARQVLDY